MHAEGWGLIALVTAFEVSAQHVDGLCGLMDVAQGAGCVDDVGVEDAVLRDGAPGGDQALVGLV